MQSSAWHAGTVRVRNISYVYKWLQSFLYLLVRRPTCFGCLRYALSLAFVPTITKPFLTLEHIRCSTYCPGDRALRRHTHSTPLHYLFHTNPQYKVPRCTFRNYTASLSGMAKYRLCADSSPGRQRVVQK